MTLASDVAGPGVGTPGAVLAAAREAAGLTPSDVAAQMRISLRQLDAIEADRYADLPGAVFVRGFVRNYARLLNLDPAPLLQALEPALGSDAPLKAQHYEGAMPDTRAGRARLWLVVFLVLLAVVLGAAAYEYWRGRAMTEPATGAPAKDFAAMPPPVASAVDTPASGASSEPVPLAPERIADVPAAVSESAGTPAVAESRAASTPQAAPPPGTSRLRIEFVRESWLEVRDKDGKVLFSGTGGAGSEQSFDVASPAELVVGNASGVRITYNRQPVDVTARAARNIARLTLE